MIKSFKDDKKVKLTLSGKKLNIKLHEVSIVNDDAKLLFKNESGIYGKEIPDINTYQGKVIDNKNSDVTLTVSNNVMVGSVDVENETYIIDQTNKEKNGKVIYVSYKSSDIKESNKSTSISMDDIDGETTSLQTTVSSSDTLTTSSTTYTIDFLPAYGPDFNNLFSEPETEISSMVNEINDDVYSTEGVTLEITSYKQFSDIPQGTTSEILHFFEDEIPEYRDITNSDLAFLFYGKNFEDDTIGRADSYNGDDSQAHGVAQMIANHLVVIQLTIKIGVF
ncbi:MAG: hypothetical protein ACLFMM_00815 [Methanohalobium sp.]